MEFITSEEKATLEAKLERLRDNRPKIIGSPIAWASILPSASVVIAVRSSSSSASCAIDQSSCSSVPSPDSAPKAS